MSEAEQPHMISIDGELCYWRVFEIHQDFKDRPRGSAGERLFSTPFGLEDKDSLAVVLGDFPERVRQALLQHRTRGMYILNRFTGAYQGMSVEEQEEAITALEGQWNLDDLKIGQGIHLTLEMRRPVSLQIDADRKYLWDSARSCRPGPKEFEEFARKARPVLDAAMPWLLPALGNHLELGRMVVAGHRAYLLVPNRAALTMPQVSVTAEAGVVSVGNWDEQPWPKLAQTLQAYPSHMAEAEDLLAAPGHWLALSLGEKDSVRRFLFAYCGLETLANKVVSRWRPSLVASLSREFPGVPVAELLWPVAQDDQYPHRNLVFRFAALGTLVSRNSAERDTILFRKIAKARNNLAHGGADSLDELPHPDAVALLQRYLSLVAHAAQDPGQLAAKSSGKSARG